MNRIEKLLELLAATPDDNFLQHALALEYVKAGKDEAAQKLFENILTKSSDYVGSYYHLAKLFERNNNIEQALSWYEKGMAAAKQAGDQHAYNELQGAYDELL